MFDLQFTSEQPTIQTPEHPNNQTSEHPNIQTTEQSNNQTSKQPNNQTSKHFLNNRKQVKNFRGQINYTRKPHFRHQSSTARCCSNPFRIRCARADSNISENLSLKIFPSSRCASASMQQGTTFPSERMAIWSRKP